MNDEESADRGGNTTDFESRVLAFERAWQQGNPPTIRDFLPTCGNPAERLRLLGELIAIDLEYRWRRAAQHDRSPQAFRLDDYIRQFPELGSMGELPLDLICEEYRVRHCWGDRPDHEEFLASFGGRRERVASRFHQIARELDAEKDDDSGPNPPVTKEMTTCFDGAVDPRAPLAYSDFVLQRMIGAGRMGRVYCARQRSLDRTVAIKFLRKSFLHDREAVERFITEARTVARLRHPGVVGIHGLGRTPGSGYFLVMEWIDGPDLARIIQSRGPLPVAEAVRWTMHACEAIEHIHQFGIVHCDLKPGNLLLGSDGHVHVTDFGLARSLTDDAPTYEGIEGTAPFMAPEQISRHWGLIGPRTDVYGLGAVLYTLLTGRSPWTGPMLPDVLARVVSAAPVTPPTRFRPEIPAALVETCLRCLAKSPEQRFPTVRAMREALVDDKSKTTAALEPPLARWFEEDGGCYC